MRQHSSDRVRLRKLRAKYRKRMWIVGIIFLIIGLVLGVFLGKFLFEDKADPAAATMGYAAITPTPEATVEPVVVPEITAVPAAPVATAEPVAVTAEPVSATAVPTAEPVAEQPAGDGYTIALPEATATPAPVPSVKATVPFGESYTFTTQIKADGSARIGEGADAYETISFTLTMKEYMRPADFANKYSNKYKLQGTEAGAGFELILNDYTGAATIVPQNVIKVGFESASGNTTELGYQLMDAEIAGNFGIAVATNTPKMLYKRYVYSNAGEQMEYLAVSCYNNGKIEKILFELEPEIVVTPTPAIVYETLQKGDKSDAVADLQARLIELDYLSGSADGDYGGKTVSAVKTAQKVYGMEETGIADPAFQTRLFAEVQ